MKCDKSCRNYSHCLFRRTDLFRSETLTNEGEECKYYEQERKGGVE